MVSLDFQEAPAAKKPAKDYDDLFDDDDDDRVMDEGLSDTNSPVKKAVTGNDDDDDDDFLMPATGRVRNRGAILDDENSLGEWKKKSECGGGMVRYKWRNKTKTWRCWFVIKLLGHHKLPEQRQPACYRFFQSVEVHWRNEQ